MKSKTSDTQDTRSLLRVGVVEATDIGQLFHDKSLGLIYLSLKLAENIDEYLPAGRVMHGWIEGMLDRYVR